jgi:hypothetical protein
MMPSNPRSWPLACVCLPRRRHRPTLGARLTSTAKTLMFGGVTSHEAHSEAAFRVIKANVIIEYINTLINIR